MSIKKTLYPLGLLILLTDVFAQTEGGVITEVLKQILPRGYFTIATQLNISPAGALFIFLLVWMLSSGIIWMGLQRISEVSSENKGATLFTVALGGIVAYGIGLWAVTFTLMVSIVAVLAISYVGLIIYRVFRGTAAEFGKFEMEMRKEMSEAKKEFLMTERDLKQIEADYKLFSSILSRETGMAGRRVKTFLDNIQRLIKTARYAIYTGDPSQINRALAEVKILKKELEYIKGILPEDAKTLKLVEMLENNLNSIENELKNAVRDELRIIRELETIVRNQIAQFENRLNQLDQRITQIDQEMKRDIARIREELQDFVRRGEFKRFHRDIINRLSNLEIHLSNLDRQLQELESDIQANEQEFIRLEAAIMKLGDKGRHIAQELGRLKHEYERLKQEFEMEQKLLRSQINQLRRSVQRISRRSKINREYLLSIIQTLQEIESNVDALTERHRELRRQLDGIHYIFRTHLEYLH